MAARLIPTGIKFGDNTILSSLYGIVPQNSTAIFSQANAPTGWTKSTAHNNKALRVVSGTGGGSGGSGSFTSLTSRTVSISNLSANGTVGNHTLTIGQIPSHTHGNGGFQGLSSPGGDVRSGTGWTIVNNSTNSSGGSGSHNHPWSGTLNFSVTIDFNLSYVDVIVCSFN
jgi:hypothetical protein